MSEETDEKVLEKANGLTTALQEVDGVRRGVFRIVYEDDDENKNVIHGAIVNDSSEKLEELDDLYNILEGD